jgi:hypothetical protein
MRLHLIASQSGDSEEGESGSDFATCLKVPAEAALAGVTYNFGQSTMMKARLVSLGSNGHYFPKGYGRPPGQSLCLILGRMRLSCSRISLLLGFTCPHT